MGFEINLGQRGTQNPRGIWAITQTGRDQEDNPGFKGKLLSALVDCGGSATIDRLVTETGTPYERIKGVLQILEKQHCVQCQS